jgi:hypothetical protein
VLAADHVNCLTERAVTYLRREYVGTAAAPTFSVVPCCADFDLFRLPLTVGATRSELGIAQDATVLLYLGSIGVEYLLDRMMTLFVQLRGLRRTQFSCLSSTMPRIPFMLRLPVPDCPARRSASSARRDHGCRR